MNRLIFLILLILVGCSKDDIIEITEPIQTTIDNTITSDYIYTAFLNKEYSNNSSQNEIPDLFLNSIELMYDNPSDKIVIDYNNDGMMDLIHSNSDYNLSFSGIETRRNIQFYMGDSNGNLILDEINSSKFLGLIHSIRGITVDLNEDGYLDIFFAGTGVHGDGTYHDNRFEYPVLLINDRNGSFNEHRLYSVIGYWHGATSGDIDGDGDSEILIISPEYESESYIIDFDNKVELTELPIEERKRFGRYSHELMDLNNDGYDDLVLASDDRGLTDMKSFLWLNSENGFNDILFLPENEYETCTDINFFDIDSDGDLDIILSKTKQYQKAYIQIIRNNINNLEDVTDLYIDNNFDFPGGSIEKIFISDNDGDGIVELRTYRNVETVFEWEFVDNKFIRKK